MSESIWPTVHAERRALADDLADLSGPQWAVPTACPAWNVHGVLAHLLSAATMTPPKFFGKFVAAGFDFDRYVGKEVERECAGGPAATLAAFRAAAERTSAPPGPKETWLGEVLVHGEDIRRALGISHAYPLDAVTRTIAFYARSQPVIGGRDRVAGLTLEATDTDFSVGSGPLVKGPAVALMLAATGRAAALSDLSGPGVETLRSR